MKKIFLVLFSLMMMCSVSFGIEAEKNYTEYIANHSKAPEEDKYFGGAYTSKQIFDFINNYYSEPSNNAYRVYFDAFINDINERGYKYCIYYNETIKKYVFLQLANGTELGIYKNGSNYQFLFINDKDYSNVLGCVHGLKETQAYYLWAVNGYHLFSASTTEIVPFLTNIVKTNCDIYKINNSETSGIYYWDGVSYFEQENSGETDDNVSKLTDEDIAEIVERFINSDVYLEKAYYNGNYFITYDNLTGYFRGYSYSWNIDLTIEYGNYDEEGNFVTTGTKEGEAWRIRPYEFSGDIFVKFGDWLASKFNTYSFEYFSISPDSSIKPRYIGSLEHNYCSNYKENEVVIYSSKQIRYVGEETNSEGKTETVVTDNYIPPTVLKDSETGEQIIIKDNLINSSDSLENVITPNADFLGLKQAFEKYISFVNISSITWLTTAISSMVTIFVPFVALGIIIFLINRILNGGS